VSDGCAYLPAAVSDVPQLVQLLNLLFAIEQDFQADPEKQARGLRQLIATPENAVIMTARNPDGNVIGMVSAQLVISTAEGTYSAWIEDMVIAEGWRAKGIGRHLLSAALDWAHLRGATRAQLLVDLDNAPALGYYEHLGWQATRLGARRISLSL
jgi:GNAT superfamily N-acetyltransferase